MKDAEAKKLGLLFYTAGRFEGLKADAGSTIEFVESNDGIVLPSQTDVSIIRDMKSAWYAIEPDNGKVTINNFINAHGNMLASTNTQQPGKLRERPVQVSFGGGLRLWPAKDASVSRELFAEKIAEAVIGDYDAHEKAARLFANVAKLQPFPDGNKRTAIIVANRMLIPENEVLLIPYTDDEYQTFMANLEGIYRDEISLDEFGSYFKTHVREVKDIDVTQPFGKIVDLTAKTQVYTEQDLTRDNSARSR